MLYVNTIGNKCFSFLFNDTIHFYFISFFGGHYQIARTVPKHGPKGRHDVKKPNSNIYGELDVASSNPDDLSRRSIQNAKTVRLNIPSVKRRKCVPISGSGSVGLQECSMIEKQQKLASKHCGKTLERNILSSSDSASSKGSLSESHMPTRKSKRAAASSLENAVTSNKHTVEPSKCPRTKLKDTCGSKVGGEFFQISKVEYCLLYLHVHLSIFHR